MIIKCITTHSTAMYGSDPYRQLMKKDQFQVVVATFHTYLVYGFKLESLFTLGCTLWFQ